MQFLGSEMTSAHSYCKDQNTENIMEMKRIRKIANFERSCRVQEGVLRFERKSKETAAVNNSWVHIRLYASRTHD